MINKHFRKIIYGLTWICLISATSGFQYELKSSGGWFTLWGAIRLVWILITIIYSAQVVIVEKVPGNKTLKAVVLLLFAFIVGAHFPISEEYFGMTAECALFTSSLGCGFAALVVQLINRLKNKVKYSECDC